MVTTTLAEGFDYLQVRLVMNVDESESLVIFAQESGRVGRDVKRTYSMDLLPGSWEPQMTDSPPVYPHKAANYRDNLALQKR